MYMTCFGLIYLDTISSHISVEIIKESLLVGYCLYFFPPSLVPQIFEYTLSLYIYFAFSLLK